MHATRGGMKMRRRCLAMLLGSLAMLHRRPAELHRRPAELLRRPAKEHRRAVIRTPRRARPRTRAENAPSRARDQRRPVIRTGGRGARREGRAGRVLGRGGILVLTFGPAPARESAEAYDAALASSSPSPGSVASRRLADSAHASTYCVCVRWWGGRGKKKREMRNVSTIPTNAISSTIAISSIEYAVSCCFCPGVAACAACIAGIR